MYRIQTGAGGLIYSPAHANTSKSFGVINPRLTTELNRAGSLTFTLQPSNAQYNSLEVLKTKVVVSQDSQMIFRGRVTDISIDTYLQKTVYVEGDLAYLNDSIQRPYEYEGAVSALFSMLLENHNAQVDDDKKLLPGTITAISNAEETHVKVADYSDTFTEITTRILDVYGGYLKIRYAAGGVCYLDYLAQYDTASAQEVAFGENIVSLDAGSNTNDIFTVLIPLGGSVKGEDGQMKPLTIESVNGGADYIESESGIAQYGRIVRVNTWSHITDPAKLMAKAEEYLAYGITENSTLSIRAVDMHLLDGTIDKIRLGGYVNIQAAPHGITRPEICARIDLDMISPENTVYTFGEAKKSLTENVVTVMQKMGGGGGGGMGTGLEEEILWLERWAEIYADEKLAKIELLTGQIDHFNQRFSNAEFRLDAVEPEVEILADAYTVIDGRITGAESSIKVNADNIALKVNKNGVISSINQSAEEVTISASRINLSGYVTASQFYAETADFLTTDALRSGVTLLTAGWVDADNVDALALKASAFTLADYAVKVGTLKMGNLVNEKLLSINAAVDLTHSHAIDVAEDGTVTLGEVSETGGNFKIADTKAYKEGVSAAKQSVRESVVLTNTDGWQSGGNFTVKALNANGQTYVVTLPDFKISGGTTFNASHKTTVDFLTDSVNKPLKSVEVDASAVYDEGYNAGWAAAAAIFDMSWSGGTYNHTLTITHAGETAEAANATETVKVLVTCTQEAITSKPGNILYTSSAARAYTSTNGGSSIQRAYDNDTTQTTGTLGA